MLSPKPNPFRYFNSSPEVIRLTVMMYVRYPLSLRNVEDLLHERGIDICHETVRFWWNRFGPLFAGDIRKRRTRAGNFSLWRWHVDEVFVKINGELHYLWRAVDQDGDVLDILVQSRRDKKAAKKFFRKLLKGLRYVPRVIITDKLKSYSAARAELMSSVEHHQQKYQNNRAENSHQPTRLRERVMRRFKSAGHAQRFLSAFGIITSHFRVGRHLYRASAYRTVMKSRFGLWEEAICVEAMVN